MKIRRSLLVLFALTVISIGIANAEGFQGLSWGSSIASIKKKFPGAHQDPLPSDMYGDCQNADGTTYKCSLDKSRCQEMGVSCYPRLRVKNYRIGNYPFEVHFELSKEKTLHDVSLTYSGDLVGQPIQQGWRIYKDMLDLLERKYGEPSSREKYGEMVGSIKTIHIAYAQSKWQVDGNRIALNLDGYFDPKNRDFIGDLAKPSITIIYRPIIDEAASKL